MKFPALPRRRLIHFTTMIAIVLIYYWAIEGSNTNPVTFFRGIPFMGQLVD